MLSIVASMASLSWFSGRSSTWSLCVIIAILSPCLSPAFSLACFGMATCPLAVTVAVLISTIILLVR